MIIKVYAKAVTLYKKSLLFGANKLQLMLKSRTEKSTVISERGIRSRSVPDLKC